MSIYMFKFRYVCPDPKINVEMSIFISTWNICVHSLEKYMSKSMYGSRFNVFFDIYIEAEVSSYISACNIMQMGCLRFLMNAVNICRSRMKGS